MLNEIIEWLNQFNEAISVVVLEDNKYVTIDDTFEKETFIRNISTYDFNLQGVSEKEFYISVDNKEYTIQVSNFEFESELDL